MKLTKDLKSKIDNYFDNITSEELYAISVKKYGFSQDVSFEIDNELFETVNKENYNSLIDNSFDLSKETSMPLAA